jgi:hypothetical protein
VAEGSGLLNRHTASSRIVSSNLIPSASINSSSRSHLFAGHYIAVSELLRFGGQAEEGVTVLGRHSAIDIVVGDTGQHP